MKAAACVHDISAQVQRSDVREVIEVEHWVRMARNMQLLACFADVQNKSGEDEGAWRRPLERLKGDHSLFYDRDWSKEFMKELLKQYHALQDGSADTEHSGGRKSKSRKRGKTSWNDPADAAWRHEEPWVCAVPGRQRIIKVNGGKSTGWLTLPERATAQLLHWYDHGQLLDTIEGVLVDEVNRLVYDYRIEGGKYLTQYNRNRSGEPRECQIIQGEMQHW